MAAAAVVMGYPRGASNGQLFSSAHVMLSRSASAQVFTSTQPLVLSKLIALPWNWCRLNHAGSSNHSMCVQQLCHLLLLLKMPSPWRCILDPVTLAIVDRDLYFAIAMRRPVDGRGCRCAGGAPSLLLASVVEDLETLPFVAVQGSIHHSRRW